MSGATVKFARNLSKGIALTVVVLITALGGVGFYASYQGLVKEAAAQGAQVPWAVPVLLDGSLIAMALVIFTTRVNGWGKLRRNSFLLASFTGATIFINLMHGQVGLPEIMGGEGGTADWVVLFIIHSLGPIAVWLNTELVSWFVGRLFDEYQAEVEARIEASKPRLTEEEIRLNEVVEAKRDGRSNAALAKEMGIHPSTVGRWVNQAKDLNLL